jgi:glycosyltransferase involved in cell wall biosynthesis
MRICIVSGYPPNIGRGAESTSMLVEALSKCKEISEIYVLGNVASTSPSEERAHNIGVCRVWSQNCLKSLIKVPRQITRINPDIVHVIYGYLYYGKPVFSAVFILLLLFFLKILRKPVIVTIHQVFSIQEVTEKFRSRFATSLPMMVIKVGFILLNKAIGSLSTLVVAIHEKHVEILKEYKVKATYIPVGLSRRKLITREQAKRTLHMDGRRILLVFGFIVPYKGIEFAIQAMPKIIEKFPDALLIIAGTIIPSLSSSKEVKDYVNDLKLKIERLGLSRNVLFIDSYIPEEEALLYFAACEVMILPYTEQSGPSEVQKVATIYEIPIVATNVDYFKDDIQDGINGLLVDPRNSESIAKAVIELLTNNELRVKISQNLKRIAKEYTVETVAEQLIRLYEQLVSSNFH